MTNTTKQILNPLYVQQRIQQKLFKFNAGMELAWAWNAGENILLTGKGGYGKSDAAVEFASILFEAGLTQSPNPYILAFGQGMTEERLLGGLDIKRFQSSGEINYLLANAFVSHEVVIFEELFDAFPAVLLILKDILQSRTVRMGDQVMPIKTKMIVACTNRSYDEVVSDNSTAALMERLIFESEVAWSSWETSDYKSAFMCATGFLETTVEQPMFVEAATTSTMLQDIIASVATCAAEASRGENKISPRTAGKALKSATINGLQSLRGIRGFGKAVEAELKIQDSRRLDREQAATLNSTLSNVYAICKEAADLNSGIRIAEIAKRVSVELLPVFMTSIRDSNKTMAIDCYRSANQAVEGLLTRVGSIIVNPKEGSFAQKLKSAIDANSYSAALALVNI